MTPYSIPEIKKPADGQWFISFNYAVPDILLPYFPRSTQRFKRYGNINSFEGEKKEQNAIKLCKDWEFALEHLRYNPFQDYLEVLERIIKEEQQPVIVPANPPKEEAKVEAAPQQKEPEKLTESELRKLTSIEKAFDLYLSDFKERNTNGNSISSYKGVVKWLSAYFDLDKRLQDPISSVTHLDIYGASMHTKKERKWGKITYNKAVNMSMIVFNWLANQDFIEKNPSTKRIKKIKAKATKNKWYTRELALKVKAKLIERGCMPVYYASAFTYLVGIRSKKELMKLKIGDIDRELKRVHFSADLSKNEEECYRGYSGDFEKILDELEFDKYPSNFFVFGKNGVPSEQRCHKDFLAVMFKPVREELNLSSKYTIYSWKHTSVIHKMMLKMDPYAIMHFCRHESLETTMAYMRDFDLNLSNVYNTEDCRF